MRLNSLKYIITKRLVGVCQFTLIIFVFFAFLLSGCSLFEKYPGYSKTSTGIYYQLIQIGDDVNPPKTTDYVTVQLIYSNIFDSVFFTGTRTFKLTEPEFKGSIDECFLMLSEGDSASFIIDGNLFFANTLKAQLPKFLADNSALKVGIKIDEIRSQEQYDNDKVEFLKWIEDFGEYEKLILSKFIQEEEINVEADENGMYYIQLRQGSGKPVELGDVVTVHYEGRFLNGKFFDSTVKRQQAFEFVYGSEMQVIPGMEDAIGRMREGEKAIVILPSELAWGDGGSSTGIIPPFTSVMYEIELVEAITRNYSKEDEASSSKQ